MSSVIAQNLNSLAAEIDRHHQEALQAGGVALQHALACGAALAHAQQCCASDWYRWLAENTTVSVRTAQIYLRLHRNRDKLPQDEMVSIRKAILALPRATRSTAAPLSASPKAKPSKNGKSKGGKKEQSLLPYPDDAKIDRLLQETAAALEARQQAFGSTPELKAIIDDLDALTARWHELAGKPAPEQEIIPDELDTDEFRELWDEWKNYRKEIKNRLSPTMRRRQLKKLAEWGLEVAIKSVETSMTNGWRGLFPPEEKKVKSGGRAGIKAALGK